METNHLDKQNFFDLGNLDSLRKEALTSGDASTDASKAALKKAAAQFEAIFTQMLLKGMRKANEAFEDKDSPFNSSGVKFFEEMHDQQLSTELSSNGSLGLADLIVQQLSPESKNFMPGSVLRTTNDISAIRKSDPLFLMSKKISNPILSLRVLKPILLSLKSILQRLKPIAQHLKMQKSL